MSTRSKSLVKDQDSLLIFGIDSSKIHKRLDNYSKPNSSNLLSSRLELSSSRLDDQIKVQESFNISEIYREIGVNKENMLKSLEEASQENLETSDMLSLIEDNIGIRQKTISKLDESSIVGENCRVILKEPEKNVMELVKKQQKKYYKAFMIMQAHFVSAKESSERKIQALVNQISEVNGLIRENQEFSYRLEASVSSRIECIKDELMEKFTQDAERLVQKYKARECEMRMQTKNKIISLSKNVDGCNDRVYKSFDESKAKNSEELLRKNCEMRLKIALRQNEDHEG
ncbi:hypothetical protein SteCoe_6024 [Stentor coeruleus]|uniref:DUF4201 domain-containing protein n=1 Tax=Stentor coeruleus TaxID=5963 RepID=A0A1R2CR09_9CILI|nr:hypothetical protein SteCoe_6024 [Stentor coeruleus]